MPTDDPMTWQDYWPFYGLGALALIAIVVVFRGLRRPADSSKNASGGGGSSFQGKGGRW